MDDQPADRRVAFVTGASRGIGKACAVQLARAGFDVAVLARTIVEGEAREHSSTIARSDTTPLPGSLTTTADLIRAEGRDALVLFGDLLDRASLGAAATTVLERWGRVDVLVNNARYIGPGHMDRLLDTPPRAPRPPPGRQRHGAARAQPLAVAADDRTRRGADREHHLGRRLDGSRRAGRRGWMGPRLCDLEGCAASGRGRANAELQGTGVVCVNVDPGYVATERIAQDMAGFGFAASDAAPPDAVGTAVAWLASGDRAKEWGNRMFVAQDVCAEQGLLPGFTPVPNPG